MPEHKDQQTRQERTRECTPTQATTGYYYLSANGCRCGPKKTITILLESANESQRTLNQDQVIQGRQLIAGGTHKNGVGDQCNSRSCCPTGQPG